MRNMKCNDCAKFSKKEAGAEGYAKCDHGGFRKGSFPACNLFVLTKSRRHNDDVNMMSKTDTKGRDDD